MSSMLTDRAPELVAAVMTARGLDATDPTRAYAAAAWSCVTEPGDGIAGRLVQALGPDQALEAVIARREAQIADVCGIGADDLAKALARWRPRLSRRDVETALERAAAADVSLLTPDDHRWPAGLRDLGAHAPVCLWVRGDPTRLPEPAGALAVVGARAATGYGEHVAIEIASELAGRGVTIVSGAAYGIDGSAHRAALTAGGITVALLAGGSDRPYPSGHTQLLHRIAAAGVVASEVPCGSTPTKWRFLQRNRLIAAMAGATVVVEAGWRSGSLNTAGHASALGRPLGAVPGPVTSAASAGCHRLLREFDASCITGPDDAAELLGVKAAPAPSTACDDSPRTDDRTRIADALASRSWRGVDEIARRSGMAPADVRNQLGMLQLGGEAESDGDRWRRGRR